MKRLIYTVLVLALALPTVSYAGSVKPWAIEVFVTTKTKISNIKKIERKTGVDVQLHYVDRNKINVMKTKKLVMQSKFSSKEGAEEAIRKAREKPEFRAIMNDIKIGGETYVKSLQYNIVKVPAIVFDEKFIVYGETLENALSIYTRKMNKDMEQWR